MDAVANLVQQGQPTASGSSITVEKHKTNFERQYGTFEDKTSQNIVRWLRKADKYQNAHMIQGIPAFRDFTIRDPRYFVILFEAKFHDFEEKNPKKFFFSDFFFLDFFIVIYSFLFVYSDCHLMNIKISLLDMTITRNSLRM